MAPRRIRAADGSVYEHVFQRWVEALARQYGWRIFHAPDNKPAVALDRDERRLLMSALATLDRRAGGLDRPVLGRLRRKLIGKAGRSVQKVEAGFPDLILLRDAELLVIELKTDRGRVAPEQREWLEAWSAFAGAVAGARGASAATPVVDVAVWRPDDWDRLHQRLARGRRMIPASFDPRRATSEGLG
jgi:hypothetical protein